MNNELTVPLQEDQVDFIFVWHFIQRQRVFIAMAFLVIIIIAVIYTITRPVSWQSRASIFVGERFFFQVQEMEKSEEIRYRYSKEVVVAPTSVVVTPIRNTRIVEIRATENGKGLAIKKLKKTINEIIENHRKMLEYKKVEFINLLNTINKDNIDKTELLRLLDNASTSVLTRQVTEIITEEDTYGSTFMKIMGVGLLAGIAFTFLLAAIKDYIERKTKRVQKPL